MKKKCKKCGKKMKFDDSPTQGWACEECGYRKDIDGKEYFEGKLLINL